MAAPEGPPYERSEMLGRGRGGGLLRKPPYGRSEMLPLGRFEKGDESEFCFILQIDIAADGVDRSTWMCTHHVDNACQDTVIRHPAVEPLHSNTNFRLDRYRTQRHFSSNFDPVYQRTAPPEILELAYDTLRAVAHVRVPMVFFMLI